MPSANTGLAPRHYFIDALRVIAIGLMFVFHVSMIFAAESPWHIKNEEQSRVLLEVNYFLSFFRAPPRLPDELPDLKAEACIEDLISWAVSG